MPRDLDGFDFRESAVNETQIRQLHAGEYLASARNIVFVDGTGTGKTHLATALARQVIVQGKRARFYSVVDLVNQLDAEKREGRAGRLATRLLHQHAIVLDELGYLPFAQDGGALLFHLISKLYERVSLIVTTNLTSGEWSKTSISEDCSCSLERCSSSGSVAQLLTRTGAVRLESRTMALPGVRTTCGSRLGTAHIPEEPFD